MDTPTAAVPSTSPVRQRLPDRRRWILVGLLSPILASGSLLFTVIVLVSINFVPTYTPGVVDLTWALGVSTAAGALTGLAVALAAGVHPGAAVLLGVLAAGTCVLLGRATGTGVGDGYAVAVPIAAGTMLGAVLTRHRPGIGSRRARLVIATLLSPLIAALAPLVALLPVVPESATVWSLLTGALTGVVMALICGLHRSRLGAVALVGALAGVIALALPPTPGTLLIAATTTVAVWLLNYHPGVRA